MTKLEILLAKHRSQPLSTRLIEDLLRQARFTGPVTTHWRDGIPCQIEAGKPITLPLQDSPVSSVKEPLDKAG